MRYLSRLFIFIFINEANYFSQLLKMLVSDHVDFLNLLLLKIDFADIFFFIQL